MRDLIVETRVGKLRGKRETACNGTEYFSFNGIPYAKPPVGELRFKDPEPLEPWTGIREAENPGPNCAHIDFYSNQFKGSDDCLYLNVHAKSIDSKQRWPVMVWFHSGAFFAGNGEDYGPDYFMRKDVVLITINYRIGVLGFLNLDDEAASGNQGLKDQVMALRWVRDNIANFGGNPDNVTIFGNSAGGTSVHYHAIFPSAKGLFHKAIAQSGVAFSCTWAYHHHSKLKDSAYRLCERLGHIEKDPKSIVEFLRTIDVQKLIEAQQKIATEQENIRTEFPFGPSRDSTSKSPFMPVDPVEAAENGIQVPLIIGYTSREGLVYLNGFKAYLNNADLEFDTLLNRNARDAVKKSYNLTPEDLNSIYFNDEPITKQSLEKLVDFSGDLCLVEGIQRVINIQIKKKCAPTYVYQLTYDREQSSLKKLKNIQMSGAIHADELELLFKRQIGKFKVESPKRDSVKHRISEQLIDMWVNFATTGNPTPQTSELLPIDWQPIDEKSGLRYLNICEDLRMEVALGISQQYAARKYPKHGVHEYNQTTRF